MSKKSKVEVEDDDEDETKDNFVIKSAKITPRIDTSK